MTDRLDVAALVAAARERTGLSDLGDDGILEGLGILVGSLNDEAKLTDAGVGRIRGSMVATLANRLRVEDWLRRHPELLERPVEKPLFVFGLPRTGTTLTINLLDADPARRGLMRWTAFDSVPPPTADTVRTDPRYVAEQARLEMSVKYAPQIAAIHYEDADSPTECQFAMSPSFCAQVYDSQYEIPAYHRWFLYEADYLPAFRYHKRLLQLLQADVGGRWTLKNPWHPLFLDALTTVYPDAQLVMTHRDPVEVVGSACSLIAAVRPMFSDQVDRHAIGRDLVETFDLMIARQEAYRAQHGQDSIYDIQYVDQLRDPVGEMRKLYVHFDEPFTAEAEAGMTAMLASNPQGKHGKHSYDLEDYDLSREGVRAHFADYCAKYSIPSRA